MKESFEWMNLAEVDKLPKDRLLKVVAKTPTPTLHPEDPNFPVRVFAETQLMRNAASLVGRPVGVNHSKLPIYGAYAIDSEWNEIEHQLESLLLVPTQYIKKVADGDITHASIEYTWRDIKDKGEDGKEFIGLSINRIDLLEGELKDMAGDSRATVTLFEAKKKTGKLLAEISLSPTLGEPFADYANWEECIADCKANHPEVTDCEAWCGAIKAKAETVVETIELTNEEYERLKTLFGAEFSKFESAFKIVETKSTPIKKAEDVVNEIKILTESLQRVTNELRVLREGQDRIIKESVIAEKAKIVKAVEAVIPKNFIVRQGNQAMVRVTHDIRKVLKEA